MLITYLLLGLHVVVCLALILVVLLQSGKGAEIGAQFGAGASGTVFGASGGQNFMGKVTASAAIIFMLTCLSLSFFYGKPDNSTIMPDQVPVEAAAPVAAPAPAVPASDAGKAPEKE